MAAQNKQLLNESQRRAAESNAGTTIVVAGPGSGKSRVLTERIKSRVANGVNPKGIWAISYTNNAAKVITDRLEGIKLGFAGTLHGAMFRLLQQHGHQIGYRSGTISIVPEDAVESMLSDVANRLRFKISMKRIKARDSQQARLIWDEYEHTLKRSNLVDFACILRDGLRIVQGGYVEGVEELYVDECQDSSDVDWAIYWAIPAKAKFLIGDPDQSIFRFRGAHPELLMAACDAPESTVLTLEQNYRSDIAICRAATALISHNSNRIHKEVAAVSEAGGAISARGCKNDGEEAMWVACGIGQCPPESSIAILCRTNYLAKTLRDFIRSQGIDVQTELRHTLPLDWNKALLIISLLMDSNDVVVERYLRLTHAVVVVNRMKLEAVAHGVRLAQLAGQTTAIIYYHLGVGIERVTDLLARHSICEECVDVIRQRITLLPQSDPTLADLLQDLYSHQQAPEAPSDQQSGVFVGTLHSAKGREWDVVFLPGWEDGLLPKFKDESEIDDERRLAFVGLTRARHRAVISWSAVRQQQWGKPEHQVSSRFIEELGL